MKIGPRKQPSGYLTHTITSDVGHDHLLTVGTVVVYDGWKMHCVGKIGYHATDMMWNENQKLAQCWTTCSTTVNDKNPGVYVRYFSNVCVDLVCIVVSIQRYPRKYNNSGL